MILAGEACSGQLAPRHERLPRMHYIGSPGSWPKRGRRFFRWTRSLAVPRLARRLHEITEQQEIAAVVAIFPDEYYLAAAYAFARQRGLPFYPYFHNTYLENRFGLAKTVAARLQRKVLAYAQAVFVMSDGLKRFYESKYPDVRFESLVHSHNEGMPGAPDVSTIGETTRLALLGNLNASNLDATKRFAEVVRSDKSLHLTVYTGTPEWYYRKVGVTGSNITLTRVAPEQASSALREHDLLILPHGLEGGLSAVEYETIFPTRTIPCLLAGRPLLAHSPAGCFLNRWLRDNECARIVDKPDVEQLRGAIDELRGNRAEREKLSGNAIEASRQFQAPLVAARMRQVLRETGVRLSSECPVAFQRPAQLQTA